MWPFSFTPKKHSEVPKIHYTVLLCLQILQKTRASYIVIVQVNAAALWWSTVQHLVHHLLLVFNHLVTYLHSPFPLDVGSHLPPFRHDSVGSEHFRPVDQMKRYLKHP